ncbi:MAG: PqqD family protein [Bacteroidaceae bacterium]|nr:PqqD family protein [Bacteroidaceae bacterium]
MKIKKGFEIQNVCGEHIIVPAGAENIDYSKIISLNETAAYLWENLTEKASFTIDDMTALLLAEYDVEESIAREDCEMIVERWKEMELIEK